MKLYLHIGTEKTATTAIQESLHLNRHALAEKGIWVSQTGGKTANRGLATACMGAGRYDDHHASLNITDELGKEELFQKMHKELNDEVNALGAEFHSVIVSSEHFHSRTVDEAEIQRVKSLLSGLFFSVEIICYVREQSETCESLYSTSIKAGNNKSLEQMAEQCVVSNPYYNYYQMLKRWKNVFSGAKFKVKVFDRRRLKNQNCIDDFYSLVKLEDVSTFEKVRSNNNESLSMCGQFIGRTINYLNQSMAGSGLTLIAKTELQALLFEKFKGRGQTLTYQTRQAIYTQFSDANTKLNKEFLGGIGNCFETPTPREGHGLSFTESDVENFAQLIVLSGTFKSLSRKNDVELFERAQKVEEHQIYKANV